MSDIDDNGDVSSFPLPGSRSLRSKDPKAVDILKEICRLLDLEKLIYRYKPTYLEAELFAAYSGVSRGATLDELEKDIHEVFPEVEVRKTFTGPIGGPTASTIRLRIPLSV